MKNIIIIMIILLLLSTRLLTKKEKIIIEEESNEEITIEILKENKVNELGRVPIMMYHGIVNMKDSETKYTKGNVDPSGYNRTTESFRRDLDTYYEKGYRMISLEDFLNKNINTELGKSPIILTFDDGNPSNIKVTGIDEEGNILIDPNSAVGILEEYKIRYPNYNITATFFITKQLFHQPEHNEKIIKWLIDNNYNIGNHTANHLNLEEQSKERIYKEINEMYDIFENIIPNQYFKIIALPFGEPTSKSSDIFQFILNTDKYKTISAMRVGWSPSLSSFHKDFDIECVQRCRAYDNNGEDFDVQAVFRELEETKYISDGNFKTITHKKENVNLTTKIDNFKTITY